MCIRDSYCCYYYYYWYYYCCCYYYYSSFAAFPGAKIPPRAGGLSYTQGCTTIWGGRRISISCWGN
eukprot:5759254-Pyramimonas_sp.AAC.1